MNRHRCQDVGAAVSAVAAVTTIAICSVVFVSGALATTHVPSTSGGGAPCYPAPNGAGTQPWAALVQADPPDTEVSPSFCLRWWYCSAPDTAAGWRPVYVWEMVSASGPPGACGLPAPLPALASGTLALLWGWWNPKSLSAAGYDWAETIWWQDFGKPKMPAKPVWVVSPASSTANPPGTRPAYPLVNGVRSTTSNGRAASDSPCNAAVGKLEGLTFYLGVNDRTDQVASCVRK